MAWIRSATWLSHNSLASYPVAAYGPEQNFPPYWKNLTPVKGGSGKLLTWAYNLWLSKGWPTKQAFPRKTTTRFCDSQQLPSVLIIALPVHSTLIALKSKHIQMGLELWPWQRLVRHLTSRQQSLEYSSLRPGAYKGIGARMTVNVLQCSCL